MDWLYHQSRTIPDAPALFSPTQEWTYKALHDAVSRLAGSIRQATSLHTGGIVAVWLTDTAEYALLIHAVRWLGCTLLPIHKSSTPDEISAIILRTRPAILITDSSRAPGIQSVLAGTECFVHVLEDILSLQGDALAAPEFPADPVTILCTSGSTGACKHVPHAMSQHEASAMASALNIRPAVGENWLCVLPFSHAGGLSILIRSMVYGSACTVLPKFRAPEVLRIIRERSIAYISLVPAMLHMLLAEENFTAEHIPSLKTILLGGAYAPGTILDEAADRGFSVLTTYGLTETASQIATLPVHAGNDKRGSAGKPLQGAAIEIRGSDGSMLPSGEAGTIAVRGPMVTRGYVGADTANTPFQNGWFLTGDTGHLDADGYLWVHHRNDRIIITGGENVDPVEVETALRTYPGITDTVVFGIPDPQWGEIVVAVLESRQALDPSKLALYCKERLSGFKVPKRWLLLPEMPRTDSGKIALAKIKTFPLEAYL